ncbi:glycolate oxidase iron-sulfur subunit [Dongia mobilis]|uniref:Glycolate oxidase iron-sulfur subunit n=1 Tax=Dongia mobilis TaxID=578943 RepID=A0A4V3DF40_9PROT|nr:glycolate oxidase subunit GlcF [Dongia mobilis]TDQ84601.1 glycolate oxidase iron-sulfur subunit [Dongia mobilis]
MQTSFTAAQLADPDIAAADRILRNCVHCGFCTATCPTYVTLGDENDSPRGRIYLVKNMLEAEAAPDAVLTKHIDRCLTCLSCMTTCPSGVDYMHLVDIARVRIEEQFVRPLPDRLLRRLLAFLLPRPGLFRLALRGGMLARAFGVASLLRGRLRALLDLLPQRLPSAAATDRPGIFGAAGVRRGRVALLAGCAQPVLDPGINAAAIRLLNRAGIEVVVAKGAGCCGALTQHMGREHEARETARRNLHAWAAEADGAGLDAILVTTSGCGTTLKDYGHLFRGDRDEKLARRIAGLARDVSEYLAEIKLPPTTNASGLKVAYHAACSLQHGQRVREAPKDLLRAAGFELCEIAESHLCCGSAGTYNLLQPEIAGQLRARKIANIRETGADLVSAGNIGCLQQLRGGLDRPVVHTVQLLDWATGGPKPSGL